NLQVRRASRLVASNTPPRRVPRPPASSCPASRRRQRTATPAGSQPPVHLLASSLLLHLCPIPHDGLQLGSLLVEAPDFRFGHLANPPLSRLDRVVHVLNAHH